MTLYLQTPTQTSVHLPLATVPSISLYFPRSHPLYGPPTVQAALFKPQCSGGSRGAKYPLNCHYTSAERHLSLWLPPKSYLEWESWETNGIRFGCACSVLYLMPFILPAYPHNPTDETSALHLPLCYSNICFPIQALWLRCPRLCV